MAKIFLSYRREDSGGYARAIQDRLMKELGADVVFMDVDGIPIGSNFVKVLNDEVAKCEVLLAVIARNWLDVRDDLGNRRLDNPNDFVRIEIEAALKRDIPVVPILLEGAKIPAASQLPEDLHDLSVRNAVEVRHSAFHGDVDRLIQGLKRLLNVKVAPEAEELGLRAEKERQAKEAEEARLKAEKERQAKEAGDARRHIAEAGRFPAVRPKVVIFSSVLGLLGAVLIFSVIAGVAITIAAGSLYFTETIGNIVLYFLLGASFLLLAYRSYSRGGSLAAQSADVGTVTFGLLGAFNIYKGIVDAFTAPAFASAADIVGWIVNVLLAGSGRDAHY
jgi:hypothetical protein